MGNTQSEPTKTSSLRMCLPVPCGRKSSSKKLALGYSKQKPGALQRTESRSTPVPLQDTVRLVISSLSQEPFIVQIGLDCSVSDLKQVIEAQTSIAVEDQCLSSQEEEFLELADSILIREAFIGDGDVILLRTRVTDMHDFLTDSEETVPVDVPLAVPLAGPLAVAVSGSSNEDAPIPVSTPAYIASLYNIFWTVHCYVSTHARVYSCCIEAVRSIRYLKSVLTQITGIPESDQQLRVEHTPLQDDLSIHSCGIQDRTLVVMDSPTVLVTTPNNKSRTDSSRDSSLNLGPFVNKLPVSLLPPPASSPRIPEVVSAVAYPFMGISLIQYDPYVQTQIAPVPALPLLMCIPELPRYPRILDEGEPHPTTQSDDSEGELSGQLDNCDTDVEEEGVDETALLSLQSKVGLSVELPHSLDGHLRLPQNSLRFSTPRSRVSSSSSSYSTPRSTCSTPVSPTLTANDMPPPFSLPLPASIPDSLMIPVPAKPLIMENNRPSRTPTEITISDVSESTSEPDFNSQFESTQDVDELNGYGLDSQFKSVVRSRAVNSRGEWVQSPSTDSVLELTVRFAKGGNGLLCIHACENIELAVSTFVRDHSLDPKHVEPLSIFVTHRIARLSQMRSYITAWPVQEDVTLADIFNLI